MTMSKTLIPALMLVAGSGWATAAGESLPSFSQVDADNNGGISETEASQVPGLVEAFAQVDINADGWLDQDEYTAVEQAYGKQET